MTEQQITILAVDDNEAHGYAVRKMLEADGFRVLIAANGTDTLLMAESQCPSAIVLDVNLPDLNGFEVCRRLKENPATAKIPVVFLTATFANEWAVKIGQSVGGAAFLFSPIEPQTLVAVLRGTLARAVG